MEPRHACTLLTNHVRSVPQQGQKGWEVQRTKACWGRQQSLEADGATLSIGSCRSRPIQIGSAWRPPPAEPSSRAAPRPLDESVLRLQSLCKRDPGVRRHTVTCTHPVDSRDHPSCNLDLHSRICPATRRAVRTITTARWALWRVQAFWAALPLARWHSCLCSGPLSAFVPFGSCRRRNVGLRGPCTSTSTCHMCAGPAFPGPLSDFASLHTSSSAGLWGVRAW